MAEVSIEEMRTVDGSNGTIKLDLNEQSELILKAYNITIACTNLTQYISSVVSSLPGVSSQGIFKNYIGNDGDLNLYSVKAQELQTLAEVMHQFALDTYSTMVNVDNIQALEIGNLLLNTQVPATSSATAEEKSRLSESQTTVRNNQQSAFDYFKSLKDK